MFKLALVVIGAVAGAAGATSWLLSEPLPDVASVAPPGLQDRLNDVKRQFAVAREHGAAAQAETENRLRHELAAFRQHPDRPGTSSAS